jgi:hypothetical protein
MSTSISSQHIFCSVLFLCTLKINYFFGAKAEIIYLPRPRVLYVCKKGGKILCTETPIAAGMNAHKKLFLGKYIYGF